MSKSYYNPTFYSPLLSRLGCILLFSILIIFLPSCGGGSIGENQISPNANGGAGSGTGTDVADGSGGVIGSGVDVADGGDGSGGGIIGTGIVLADAGSDAGGVTGSGIISAGSIDAFGSIYVNGIRYDIDNAAVTYNGASSTEETLALGMYTRVIGVVSDDGVTGTAIQVDFKLGLSGPVEGVSLSVNNLYKDVTVFGQSVLVHQTDTVFQGTTFETVGSSEWLEVSGQFLDDGRIVATRVETPSAGDEKVVRFTAEIVSVGNDSVTLSNGVIADISSVTLSGSDVIVGQSVEVVGILDETVIAGETLVTATAVDTEIGLAAVALASSQAVTLQGVMSSDIEMGLFTLEGFDIDSTNAELYPSFFQLEKGVKLLVQGLTVQDAVEAESITVQSIIEEGSITQIDESNDSFQVELLRFGQSIDFVIDDETVTIEENGSGQQLSKEALNVGDRVRVSLEFNGEGQYIAERVDRIEQYQGVTNSDPAAVELEQDLSLSGLNNITEPMLGSNVTVDSSSTLTLSIESVEQYGRLIALDTMSLDGILNIGLNYVPSLGDTFSILSWNALSANSRFSDIQLPVLPIGLAWNLVDLYDTGSIQVVEAPGSIATTPNLWLDGSDTGMNYGDGDFVSKWIDKSGNNNHSFQNVAADRPVYTISSSINGNPAITFDQNMTSNNGKFLYLPQDSIQKNQSTVFIVYRTLGSIEIVFYASDQVGLSTSDDYDGYGGSPDMFEITYGHWPDHTFVYQDGILETDWAHFGSASTNSNNLATMQWNRSGELIGRFNGVSQGSRPMHTISSNGQVNFVTLARHGRLNGDLDRLFNGVIAEVIIYDQIISLADMMAVEAFLMGKYGL